MGEKKGGGGGGTGENKKKQQDWLIAHIESFIRHKITR